MSTAIRTLELSKTFRGGRLLRRKYPDQVQALTDVSLDIAQGEVFGLVGPNGSGKTTLIRILATLLRPCQGNAWIQGRSVSEGGAVRASVGLATAEERSFFWRLTCEQNLRFFAALQGAPASRIPVVARDLEIREHLRTRFDRCSTGIKSRVGLARALLHDPPVLLLDELSRSLDPVSALTTRELLLRLVHTQGKTVLLVTHDPTEAVEMCHRVAVLHHGQLRILPQASALNDLLKPERWVRIRAADSGPLPSSGDLERIDGVDKARVEDAEGGEHEIHLNLENRLKGLSRVLEDLRQRGSKVVSVEAAPTRWHDILESVGSEPQDREVDSSQPFASASLPATSASALSLARTLKAFFSRDLSIQASYPLALALELLSILLSVASIFFVGRLVGAGAGDALAPYGGSYFSFALVGMALLTLQQLALGYFARAVRDGQLTGTLEAMLVTPTSVGTILLGGCQWPYLLALLKIFFFLVAGLMIFSLELAHARLLPFLVFLALTVLAESGLGLLSASFILAFQRGDPIRFVIGSLSALLAGTLYPVSVLPQTLQDLSVLLPLTHGLEGIRGALLQGAGLQDLRHHATALLVLVSVLLPLGIVAFTLAMRYAKKNGTLGQY